VIGWPAVVEGRPGPQQVIVHVAGTAVRLGTDVVRSEFQRSPTLQDLLLRYTSCYIAQISRSVACQRFHTVPQRLARWLLVVQDRASTSSLGLTHAGIARVLGIPRTGVTAAAGELKEAGVIWYQHGRVEIRSRRRLEREACECYGAEAAWPSAARAPEAVARPHRG
jgi:CRP-like cAMP-binding protein